MGGGEGSVIVQMPVQSPFLIDRAGVCVRERERELQETIRQAGDKNLGTKKEREEGLHRDPIK